MAALEVFSIALYIALSGLAYGLARRQESRGGAALWATLAALTLFYGVKDFIPPVSFESPIMTNVNPSPTQIDYQASWQRVRTLRPNVSAWQYQIEAAAQHCGIDPMLIAAVMSQESNGDPNAVGGQGEIGLMQIMPFADRPLAQLRADPSFNIQWGGCLLGNHLRQTGDAWEAFKRYNGSGSEAERYANKVSAIYNSFVVSAAPTVQMTGQITHPPMRGPRLTKAYGIPVSYQRAGYHTGLDLGIDIDDGIYAVGNGIIEHVGPLYCNLPGKCRGPYSIVLRLGEGLYATYSHNKEAFVEVGQVVQGGQHIGTVGSLGYSSGPHLHFEICSGCKWTGDWVQPFSPEQFIDPLPYFKGGF